jgi:hypothetical protein
MSCREFVLDKLSNCRCRSCGTRAVDHAPPYGCSGRVIDLHPDTGVCTKCGKGELDHPAFIVHIKTPFNERLLLL